MEIEYKGANCITITTKKTTIVIDPKISLVGLKDVAIKDAVVVATQPDFALQSDALTIDRPGEYEVKEASVKGVSGKRMIDHDDSERNTLYRITIGGVSFAVVGHSAMALSEDQLEAIGVVDVAIIPVGGNGYTLDAHQAVNIARQLDPRVVVPTHYADKAVTYEVDQMELEPFVKEFAASSYEKMPKWKIKNGILPEGTTVIELERAA